MKEAALEYPISAMQVNKDYGNLNVHVRSRCMLMMVIYMTEALLVASKKSGLYVNADINRAWSYLEIRMQNEF